MKHLDRRQQRTQRALHGALLNLLLRKRYDAITIQDILDEANVGRSTFYSHYSSKDDLWKGGFKNLEDELKASVHASPASGAFTFSRNMFEHARSYREVFVALLGRHAGAIATNELRRVLSKVVRKQISSVQSLGSLPCELASRFVVETMICVLTWWLVTEPKLEPAAVDVIFHRLIRGANLLPAKRAL